ncbi:MAG: hypothetical protein AB7F31_04335 [Parachlamydiales bacterium]
MDIKASPISENPVSAAQRWYNPDKLDLVSLATPMLFHNKVGYTHFKWRLERSRYDLFYSNPRRWYSHYILCSYLMEMGELVDEAKNIPIMGRLIPSKEALLLPVWIVAVAALSIECYDKAIEVHKSRQEYERKRHSQLTPKSLRLPPAPSLGDLSPRRLASFTLFYGSRLSIGALFAAREAPTYVQDKVEVVTKAFDQTAEKIELGQAYYELFLTMMMDPLALYQALIRFPEHMETIKQRGPKVLEAVFTDFLKRVETDTWISSKFDLGVLKGKKLSWVEGSFTQYEEWIGKLTPFTPEEERLSQLQLAPPPSQAEAEGKSAPSVPLIPADASVVESAQPPEPGAPHHLLWASATFLAFWMGRRYFGRTSTPT